MTDTENVTHGTQAGNAWDRNVPDAVGEAHRDMTENVEAIRAEVAASFAAARERVTRRFGGRTAPAAQLPDSRKRARELLRASRAHVRSLLGADAPAVPESAEAEPGAEQEAPALGLPDLHTLERLLSHVRHSVVERCFYNLKLLCPSLIDEYDDDLRDQVAANIGELGTARADIGQFYAQTVSGGQTISSLFPESEHRALQETDDLITLAEPARGRLDDETVRQEFADRVPGLIDGVMNALQEVQHTLDSRKIAVGEVVERAVALTRPMTEAAGLNVRCDLKDTPKVFGDATALLNCFAELVANAAKYSHGTELVIAVNLANRGGQCAQISFADNGHGMTPDELATCLTRGASRSGTGEGLPMVVEIVEAEHLGRFEIEAKPNEGCRATVCLPVKWSAK